MVEQLASQCLALQGSDVSEEQWLSVLPGLVETHGLEAVCAWYDSSNKHKHRLVHSATIKCFVRALKCMRDLGLNLNAQRDSDQCTPLHLAIFYKKHEAIDALKELGSGSGNQENQVF